MPVDEKLLKQIKLNDPNILSIDLSGNKIGDTGASALAVALKTNATVQEIYLSWNKIGDTGASALAAALNTNATVQSIDLSFNKIGDTGASALAKALKTNATVQSIDLRRNEIGNEMTRLIAKELQNNKQVQTDSNILPVQAIPNDAQLNAMQSDEKEVKCPDNDSQPDEKQRQTPSDQSSLSSVIIRLQARSDKLAKKVTQKIVSAVHVKNIQSLLIETFSTHIQNNIVFQSLLGQAEQHYAPDQVATALFRYLDVDDADDATALLSEKGHQYIIDALSQTIRTLKLDQRISIPVYGSALQHHGLFAPAPAHPENADRASLEDRQEGHIEPEYKTEYLG